MARHAKLTGSLSHSCRQMAFCVCVSFSWLFVALFNHMFKDFTKLLEARPPPAESWAFIIPKQKNKETGKNWTRQSNVSHAGILTSFLHRDGTL